MTQTLTATRISLGLGHGCDDFAGPLLLQLGGGKYDLCSVMEIPGSVDEWRSEHRTARKRASRARSGYTAGPIRREDYSDDIYQINTSLDTRQGRPMSETYRTAQAQTPLPDYPCPLHAIRTYGVWQGIQGLSATRLVAYLWLYRSGDLALVSSILGHGDHLEKDIMYLLFEAMVDAESAHEGFLVYNRHDSGTDGLRYFKERLGFTEQKVDWQP